MIAIMIFILSYSLKANEPMHWAYVNAVQNRHEFYLNNEVISKPQDAWQILFSLLYIDSGLKKLKDCIYYRVPGEEAGILKIKTMSSSSSCDESILSPGDREIKNIKSLQFSVTDKEINLDFTLSDFQNHKWQARLPDSFGVKIPQMQTSSAEFKSAKIILLAPEQNIKVPENQNYQPNTLCHNINEDCMEVSTSFCSQCPAGWYEIPNGCSEGPKYCGMLECGGKGRPACRRGMKWQRNEKSFDCRIDSTFAYCSKGLTVTCEGKKAFCR